MTQHPVRGVDHCFLLVRDLEASRDAYARFGFTVSPRGLHSPQKGSANHTIMFPHDYLELLGLIAETDQNAPRRERLLREGEGLHALACRVDDAVDAEEAVAALGIATEELSDFSRPVTLPGGAEGVAAFTTLEFAASEAPLGHCFMCQHRTPETVWIPELLEHANGAVGLAGLVAGHDAPDRLAARFARLFAAGTVTGVDGGARVETGADSAPILVLTHEALARHFAAFDLGSIPASAFAGLRIAVRDLERVRCLLDQHEVRVHETPAGLAIGPAHASGVVLEFVPAA